MKNYIIYTENYTERAVYIENAIIENNIEKAIEHYNDKIFELHCLTTYETNYIVKNNTLIDTSKNKIKYIVRIKQIIDL